jgi:hypothetical protein
MPTQTGEAAGHVSQASGPVMFARYAYPPNRLGLCGPADAPGLKDGAVAGADAEIRELSRGFEGAYPYLQLIAAESGVSDPLDRRVVEAYWLGGELSTRVGPRAMHRSATDRFRGRMAPSDWRWLELAVSGGSRPIHAFHVLEIFPRAGFMHGGDGPILETMDSCRIRWGTLVAIEGDKLVVSASHLEIRNGVLHIGEPQLETVTGWSDENGPMGGAMEGDQVSLHWGWACDRLTSRQQQRLQAWTLAALRIANQAI